ncbi:tRNA(Ile)-lysidine synthase [Andreprevotia sp. IGB-42]|nr:tRNA(Ile)-lysidine synthase [Andreprevotia sp. IGB-42]
MHHGLSPNADHWAAACAAVAASLGVPLSVQRVQVAHDDGKGVEAAARAARYAVFEAVQADVLLLAHHRGDQGETVLFNVLRGSGLAGLAGVPVQRALRSDLALLRPLLRFGRAELAAYAAAHGLRWIDDESNENLHFRRNFLRHRALPVLAESFPAVETALVRVARHAAEAQALLDEVLADDLLRCVQGCVFDLAAAAGFSPLRRNHALRGWLKQHGVVLDTRAFDEWLSQLDAPADGQPALVWRERAIRRYRQQLHVTPASLLPGPALAITADTVGALPGWSGCLGWQHQAGGLDAGLLRRAALMLRPRQGSEALRLHAGGPSRQMKTLFQERHVPPWLRAATPLLYIDGELAAVPGLGVAAAFAVADGVVPIWTIDDPATPAAQKS